MIARARFLWHRLRLWILHALHPADVPWSPQTGYLPSEIGKGLSATSDAHIYARGKAGTLRRLDKDRSLTKRQRRELAEIARTVSAANRAIQVFNGERPKE